MTHKLTPEQAAILAAHPTAIAWHGEGNCPVDPESKPVVFISNGHCDMEFGAQYAHADMWTWGHGIIAYIPDPDYPPVEWEGPLSADEEQMIEDGLRTLKNAKPRPTQQATRLRASYD
jgi:hypothetical protein